MKENRTWTIECRRGLVDQCLGTHTIEASDYITSTASAQKYLREQGWTLHDDDGTCPVCMKVWNGEVELSSKGEVRMVTNGNGGSDASRPLLEE